MGLQLAPNGNVKSATDPDFIHFDEEEKGLLLQSIPGYPRYLPCLQLSPSGRLCFWNMPSKFYKAFADDVTQKGTSNYFIAFDNVKDWNNPFQPMGGDFISTNGRQDGFPAWSEAGAIQYITAQQQADVIASIANAAKAIVPNSYLWMLPPNTTPFVAARGINGPPVINYQPPQLRLSNHQWLWSNVQYWLQQFLTQPWEVTSQANNYGNSWPVEFLNNRVGAGTLNADFLNKCNFLIMPTGKPGTMDIVGPVFFTVVAGIMTIATAGAAGAGLSPVFSAAVGGLIAATKGAVSSTIKDAATAAKINTAINSLNTTNVNQQGVQNTVNNGGFISSGSPSIDQNTFLLIAGAIILILLVVLFVKQ
jgi:hypothetical protein